MRDRSTKQRSDGGRRMSWGVVAAGVLFLASASPTAAEFGDPACLAKKLRAWGKLRKCQAVQEGKALRGLSSDVAKCRTKLEQTLARIDARAAGAPCRYGDNADGTVTDYDTGLQWEQKTDDGGLHDTDVGYNWSVGLLDAGLFLLPDGTLFADFLFALNDCGFTGSVATGGFAGHCDWRIPTRDELLGIVDPAGPGCGDIGGRCLDESVFGPLHLAPNSPHYWSSTILPPTPSLPNHAWGVEYQLPSTFLAPRGSGYRARAVRSAF